MNLRLAMIAMVLLAPLARADDAPAEPASKPAKTWAGMAEILRLVPEDIVPAKRDGWTRLKADAALASLKPTIGDELAVQLKVLDVGLLADREKDRDDEWRAERGVYYIRTQESAGPWMVVVLAYFDESHQEQLARVSKGQTLNFTGELMGFEFLNDHRGWFIYVEIRDCRFPAPKRRR